MQSQTARAVVTMLLAGVLACTGQELPRPVDKLPEKIPDKLNVVVVEGEGAINNIKKRTTRETVVRVEDENHKPVAGAAVAFLLPADGPGGSFTGGAKSASIMTDSAGRAVMPHIAVNGNPGSYSISVYASHTGAAASATISQSSALAGAALSTGGLVGIIAGVAAAGGVAAAVVSKGKSGSTGSSGASVATGAVGAGGGGSFGPPH